MKTKEELNEIRKEIEAVSEKLKELTDEELEQVVGGNIGEIRSLREKIISGGEAAGIGIGRKSFTTILSVSPQTGKTLF